MSDSIADIRNELEEARSKKKKALFWLMVVIGNILFVLFMVLVVQNTIGVEPSGPIHEVATLIYYMGIGAGMLASVMDFDHHSKRAQVLEQKLWKAEGAQEATSSVS